MDDEVKAHQEGLNQELKNYKKLDKINNSEEFNTFFDLQIDTVVKKMLECFTGKGPANWEEFTRIRGEIIAILYPIQQVRGSKILIKQMQEQIDSYYNTQV